MHKKQIYILLAVLGVFIAGIVVRQLQKPAELTVEEYTPLDLKFDTAAAASIGISKGASEPLKLAKTENGWRVENLWNARADAAKIDQFLEAINTAQGEMRAGDKDLLADFGLKEDEAFKIEVRDAAGAPLSAFFVGTRKAGFNGLFVRRADSDRVFFTQADFYSRMGIFEDPVSAAPQAEYWAALDLGFLDAGKVRRFEIKRYKKGKESIGASLVQENGKWRYAQPGQPAEPDDAKIQQYLDNFRSIRAQKIHDPRSKDFGFAKPEWRMTIGLESGEIILTAGPQNAEEKSFPLEISTEPVVFELAEYYFLMLDADNDKFFTPPPVPEAEKITP